MKHLVILTIDGDAHKADHPEGADMTPEVLTRQGAFANQDFAGVYGYESWTVVHNASPKLLDAIHNAADDTVPQERIDQLIEDPTS